IAGGAYLVLVTRLDAGHVLLAGRAASGSRSLADAVGRAASTALIFTLPAALFLAIWLGRLANARLASVAAVAGKVAGGDLTLRAARDGSGDAFDRLAGSINAMLDRIELLVGELRILSDSLAHDLRSPLTRMRARLEAARANPAETETALDVMSAEMDRLLALLATALQISRAEAGVGREHFTRSDAHALLDDVAEIFGPAAEDAGVALDVAAGAPVLVTLHRPLVQQALANLIDNALRHAAGATHITLAARLAGDGVDLVVTDDGHGIPADQRQVALSRFGRLDPARGSEEVGGAGMGLGLALVQAVARLHGGTVTLDDAGPGLIVVLHLPRQAQDAG
uniref:sensor histidine kinase n=1 Tax=Sandarakinorhabdus oryzae TaxID=2675220 RepID=UPI0012E203FE